MNLKHRKKAIGLVMLLCASILSGCTDAIPEMSDEDLHLVEEYAAHLLLKYDKNYSNKVLSEEDMADKIESLEHKALVREQVKEQKEQEEALKEEENNETSLEDEGSEGSITTEPVYADIATFLGFENVTIEHTNTVISQTYPNNTEANDFQGVAIAGRGNMLVVYEFTITNNNDYDYSVDICNMNVTASVKVNERMTKTPVSTMLLNNFQKYIEVIPAHDSRVVFIMIELSEENAYSIESAVLSLKKGNDKITTSLL